MQDRAGGGEKGLKGGGGERGGEREGGDDVAREGKGGVEREEGAERGP